MPPKTCTAGKPVLELAPGIGEFCDRPGRDSSTSTPITQIFRIKTLLEGVAELLNFDGYDQLVLDRSRRGLHRYGVGSRRRTAESRAAIATAAHHQQQHENAAKNRNCVSSTFALPPYEAQSPYHDSRERQPEREHTSRLITMRQECGV